MIPESIVEITDYRPEHLKAFKDLNVAWIEKAHVVDDVDLEVLDNPDKYILNAGGCILVAIHENEVVGTCALKSKGNKLYELTKMTVREDKRGLKIGYLLGLASLERAKELGAAEVELYSNRHTSAEAVQLYNKLGFEEIPLDTQEYARANIKMKISIE